MKFKNQIRRLFNKKASASVGVAIKVLTSVVLGAAMLAGTYGVVKTNVVPTAENKVSSMFEVTDAIELNGGGSGGVVVPDPVVEIKRNGVIPEGAVYYQGGERCDLCAKHFGVKDMLHGSTCALCGNEFTNTPTAIYSAGDNFPSTPTVGDVYVEGDYVYDYATSPYSSTGNDAKWSVRVIDDTKTSYGKIISEIAGKPLMNMDYAFNYCQSLTTAPAIPNGVTDMYCTFQGCTSLTTAPTMPSSVTDMSCMFMGCTSLTTVPTIPSSVKGMSQTFEGCTSLATAPTISSGVMSMDRTFYGCTSLTTVPTIPNSVNNMPNTFSGCTSLTTAPTIPSSVTNMAGIFYGCTSLTGKITINANPTSYDGYYRCFENTIKPITLIGSSTKLKYLANTANNGNVTVAQ